MLTPNSGLSAYCTPAQYILYEDVRQSGDLVRDDGSQASASDLLSDPVLAAMLQAASGEVESSLLAAMRYAPADLQALQSQGGNSGVFLARIVSGLTYGLLHDRRGLTVTVNASSVENARRNLEMLRTGEKVLAFAETEQAGLASNRMRTLQELNSAHLLTRSIAARRFLGGTYGRYWNGW